MIKNYLTPPITGFLLVRTNNIYNRRNFGLKAQSTNPPFLEESAKGWT